MRFCTEKFRCCRLSRQKFVEITIQKRVFRLKIPRTLLNISEVECWLNAWHIQCVHLKICGSSDSPLDVKNLRRLLAEQIFCFEQSTWSASSFLSSFKHFWLSPTSFQKIFASDDAVFCHWIHGNFSPLLTLLYFLENHQKFAKKHQQSRRVCKGNERNMKFHFRWSMIFVCCIKKN